MEQVAEDGRRSGDVEQGLGVEGQTPGRAFEAQVGVLAEITVALQGDEPGGDCRNRPRETKKKSRISGCFTTSSGRKGSKGYNKQ